MTPVDIVKLHSSLKRSGIFGAPSIAIVGFSSKGVQAGLYAKKAGFKIVGVSDDSCGIIDTGGNGGLDIQRLVKLKRGNKDFQSIELKDIRKTKPEFLSRIEVDVLIVESLEAGLAEEVRARVVLGFGKGKISKEAAGVLKTKQIPIISL